ncbi:lipid IV(A) 3-deoxy-D-manno-octulosonic acid transferase [Aliikangiella sp. IMCC44359]|uniref:lipid IV(A) 3-deoxy-D-manno-octulosonic acid transferase n=1 Tax=Aliikangiella sp. IMCC44359 TaxID=3459125 RepID=UPI00403B3884
MNRFVYSLLLYVISPVIWLYLLFRAIKAPEYRDGMAQRLGLGDNTAIRYAVMVHCASVGEVRAAAPLIEQLIKTYPNNSILVTTTTPTGKKVVESLFADSVAHRYLPVDWFMSSGRFIQAISPSLVILMETELWPNLLYHCGREKIPVLLANARLSDKSLLKYQKYPRFAQQLFENISKVAAQYSSDAENFIQLGTPSNKIELVGSIKFDVQISAEIQQRQAELSRRWRANRPVWIAASIHPAEFDWVLQTHQQLLPLFPDLLLIGVPRHPEKFAEFKDKCDAYKMSFVCRSEQVEPSTETQIIVGDTLGEMLLFCGAADIAYVGGSLIERGGHNPLEPLACGLPVIMGPHYYNFSDIGQILIDKNLMAVVKNQQALTGQLELLLKNKSELQSKSQQAIALMQDNRGCVDRLLSLSQALYSG